VNPKNRAPSKASRHRYPLAAHNLQHLAVDGVHSIDFSADERVCFLLTPKMKGVQTDSFFDSF
jgi:hypothetical protein